MTLRDLRLRVRACIAPRRVERDLDDELAFHVERETEKLVAGGLSPDEARTRARARFGSVALAADECRDARGISIVDTTARDVVYALRTFRRAPLVALTVVATVALGLGLVAAVFTLFNMFAFRVDAVRNPHELFSVQRVRVAGAERQAFTRPDYDALRRDTSVFADVFAMMPDIDSRIDGRMMGGTLVTGNFFQALGVDAALGRTLTPADDDRVAARQTMVLSHRGWSRLFAEDPTVVGRRVIVNGHPYQIVGVMPERFRGLTVAPPDYWAPLSQLAQFRPIHAGRENLIALSIVGRLTPGLSPEAAVGGLAAWAAERSGSQTVIGGRPPEITLQPRRGTIPIAGEMLAVVTPLFFAFGLILLIGCANVANLLLARAVSRQREIGIRLSLGASRRRILRQLLTESLLLALAAAVVGLLISRVVLEGTLHVVMTTMAPELLEYFHIAAPALDWRVVLFIVAGAIVSTVAFGLVPALQATRLELLRTIRGEVTRDARPGRARNSLIAVQVTASALLLICAAVFLRSTMKASAADPGLRTADTVLVDLVNEPLRAATIAAVNAEPLVTSVAASWPELLSRPRAGFAQAAAGPAAASSRLPLFYRLVSPEFFTVLDIPVRRGRVFAPDEAVPGAAVAIVSETVAHALWPTEEPVGQVLHVEADASSNTRRDDEPAQPSGAFTVIGVVRDVAGFRFGGVEETGLYFPTNATIAETSLVVRVKSDPQQARRALLARLAPVDPNMGEVITMRTLAGLETYFWRLAFWLTLALGGLALALTLSGLFSVLSYLVEHRRKEIAVRMALGATARNVMRVVLSQSFRPVGVGLLAGAGLAAVVAMALLATPLAATFAGTIQVFDPLAYAASLSVIVLACVLAASIPAFRATRIDPMTTLRQE